MKESEFQEKVDRLQAKLHAVQAERDQLQADNQRLKVRVENLFNQKRGAEYIDHGWLPKWKPWAMFFMVIIGLLGLTKSVQGYEKTNDWAKQNSAETCASQRGKNWLTALLPNLPSASFLDSFGNRRSRAEANQRRMRSDAMRRGAMNRRAQSQPQRSACTDETLINRAFLGIFSITLLCGSLIIYQRRRMEVL